MSPRLYLEIAAREYRQQLAYRFATLAGLVTNGCFGYLRGVVFVALYQGREDIASYGLLEALTYSWITQALIMIVAVWGSYEIEQTIRTGDVVSDLSRPFSYLGYWLARDYGRAAYQALYHCVPVFLIGEVLFDLRWPTVPATWVLFVTSLAMAVAISFGVRFMVNLAAFWVADARGLGGIVMAVLTLLSGFLVPIAFFPDAVRDLVGWLPFAGIMQTPANIFLERLSGTDLALALARQAAWAAAMLAAGQALLVLATRRVTIQGG